MENIATIKPYVSFHGHMDGQFLVADRHGNCVDMEESDAIALHATLSIWLADSALPSAPNHSAILKDGDHVRL